MRSNRPASSISSPASSNLGSAELEQAPHERGARVLRLVLALRLRGLDRHQHLRLDVDEGGRHHHELAGHVEVHLLHQVQVLHVPARDGRDGDVVDVDLVAADQVQEQVERTLELLQLDLRRVLRQRGLHALRDQRRLLLLRPGSARLLGGRRRVLRLLVLVAHGRG
jgi:hypothetical protein